MRNLIEKKRKSLATEEEKQNKAKVRKRKRIQKSKIEECAQKYIDSFKKEFFDPDTQSVNEIVEIFARKIDSYYGSSYDSTNGQLWVFEGIDHYTDDSGYYKALLPTKPYLWVSKENSIPTDKVKNKTLREFFQKVERTCRMKCWWIFGTSSHTSHNLNVHVSNGLFMTYQFQRGK